jgi:hypothetical protein
MENEDDYFSEDEEGEEEENDGDLIPLFGQEEDLIVNSQEDEEEDDEAVDEDDLNDDEEDDGENLSSYENEDQMLVDHDEDEEDDEFDSYSGEEFSNYDAAGEHDDEAMNYFRDRSFSDDSREYDDSLALNSGPQRRGGLGMVANIHNDLNLGMSNDLSLHEDTIRNLNSLGLTREIEQDLLRMRAVNRRGIERSRSRSENSS